MNKSIKQLEQEAKQAREALNSELTEICGAILAKPLVDSIINAAVAMVTYQLALGMQEVSGDGSGEALPEVSQEDTEVIALMKEALKEIERNTCSHEETHRGGAIWEICDICGCKWADDEGGKPEFVELKIVTDLRNYIEKSKAISQEERNSDGWIEWHGKGMPNLFFVDVKFRNGEIWNNCFSDELRWWHAKDKNVNQDIYDECVDIVAYKVASGKDNNAKLAELEGK